MKVMLLYPPEQNWPDTMCKPNGSLAYPMLAGALLEAGIEVEIYDACVGDASDDLQQTFYNSVELPNGMLRTGVTDKRILSKISDSDIIGLTSIFSHQESMVLHTVKLIKKHYPEKLIISGGVNARHRTELFFDAGVDIICNSEAEATIVQIVEAVQRRKGFSKIPGISYKQDGKVRTSSSSGAVVWDLDKLPMPAWHLLPNERYWKIRRPHGGHFDPDEDLKYASMMTSRGCPFSCSYCHIAGELSNSLSGPIGRFRIKSDERVLKELHVLKDLGVKQVFIEDDSIFGKKRRAIKLIKKIKGLGLDILDVNGVNIIHLLKKGEPDIEVIELLAEAGFRDIVLPFESANPRIIKKYCSNKWDIENSNVTGLIKECKKRNLRVAGNIMIGYPDETLEEIQKSLQYAKDRMNDGLDACNFFLVMPLPGTPMFDECMRDGYLPKNFNPDRMHWQKANMINTTVPPKKLEEIRDKAWAEINSSKFMSYKQDMIVDSNSGEIHKV